MKIEQTKNYFFVIIIVVIALFIIIFAFFNSAYFNFSQTQQILPGMPAITNSKNIYADANVGMLSDATHNALARVYVPNSLDNTVSVIDPKKYRVIDTFSAGKTPQHVVPSYDLKTLWVLNNDSDSAIPINPAIAKPGTKVSIEDPYNLYYTPDGRYAIVVGESVRKLEFRDPHTMALHDSTPIKCAGANHMDFTADGRYALVTCEFSGQLFKLDVATHKIVGYLTLSLNNSTQHSMPQDIRTALDGRIFFVADMMMNGVFLVDPVTFKQIGFIPTGKGTHSIYPSRDGQLLYIANRGCNSMTKCPPHGPGSITVLDPHTLKIVANWPLPNGGSPDMGNVSADGKELWLSGRVDDEVYVFDTTTGALTHRIKVGKGPHGLAVWPEPGRYSLGHTGNMR